MVEKAEKEMGSEGKGGDMPLTTLRERHMAASSDGCV